MQHGIFHATAVHTTSYPTYIIVATLACSELVYRVPSCISKKGHHMVLIHSKVMFVPVVVVGAVVWSRVRIDPGVTCGASFFVDSRATSTHM